MRYASMVNSARFHSLRDDESMQVHRNGSRELTSFFFACMYSNVNTPTGHRLIYHAGFCLSHAVGSGTLLHQAVWVWKEEQGIKGGEWSSGRRQNGVTIQLMGASNCLGI
jgi:hypothetical protein